MSASFLIAGVGGIGGVVGARLAEAGNQIHLLSANPAITEAIRREGIIVLQEGSKKSIPATVFTAAAELPPRARYDFILLLMKANTVLQAARELLPVASASGAPLVTCQNGIVEDAVAEAVGRERVVSAIVGWGGTMHAPGVYEKTGPGAIHLGELDGSVTQRIERLARELTAVSPTVISRNIYGALWSKLAINCAITTLGAAAGQTLGEMLSEKNIRKVFLGIYREVIETAEAAGITLEKIAAPPKLLYLERDAGWAKRFFKDLLVRLVGRRYRRLKSSMLQSLERGKPTEIDFLNGYVVEAAARLGREVPLNRELVKLIKEIESGRRSATVKNLEPLFSLA